MNVLMSALQKVIAHVIETPESLARFIMGNDSPPTKNDLPEGYYDELQAVIPKNPMTVYRAFSWSESVQGFTGEGHPYNPFTGDLPLISFTASKETALAIAKEKSEDYPDEFAYAVSMRIQPEEIYFHYKYNDIGREHPKEKEITIDPSGNSFNILKEYEPYQ